MVRRDRYTDDQLDQLPFDAQAREEVLWTRLRGLDYLCFALGSYEEPEVVEALFGPAVLPANPQYEDENEPESPGAREALDRIYALRIRVEMEYALLARLILRP